MEKIIILSGQAIKVVFDDHAVHITNDEQLAALLEGNKEQATGELVSAIGTQFRQLYHRELDISEASLAVEIWGHVYCGHLAEVLENLIRLKLVEKIADKIIAYCEVIDCGEAGYDSNRGFWDLLAPFKSGIAGWLPGSGQHKDAG